MSDVTPWDVLSTPNKGEFTRRKVRIGQLFNIYWVLDEENYKGLLIPVDVSVDTERLLRSNFKLKGVAFHLVKDEEPLLLIKLVKNEYQSIFLKLCLDLCDVIYSCKSSSQIFPAVTNRVSAWRKLLANSNGSLLNDLEKQGLFAELLFIKYFLEKKPKLEHEIIDGWKGPEKSQHDFVIGERSIEIKSITNSSRNKISVSSEDQLYTKLTEFYLRVYFMIVHSQGQCGKSINKLVESIYSMIECEENSALLEAKLLEAKYINILDNDYPRFTCKEISNYEVVDGFPRIIPEYTLDGVNSIKYKVEISAMENFRVTEEIFWNENE